jgi:hypothetical protein
MTYEKALTEFSRLPRVNRDDLDGTIDHLVFRAQHELDLEDEGENEYIDFSMSVVEYKQLKRFINKWQNK